MQAQRREAQGSRYLYEPFDSAHARIETHERVFEERWTALNRTLEHIERALERLERRLWLAVCSVAIALLSQLIALIWTAPT